MGMPIPARWIMRLPTGVRQQPGWLFIGLLVFLSGLSFMLGVTTSTIQEAIGKTGLRGWGAFLAVTGLLVVYATWRAKPSLEKMALRWLILSVLSYASWLLTVVSWRQSVMSVVLSLILCVLAEIRVGFLKLTLDLAGRVRDEE